MRRATGAGESDHGWLVELAGVCRLFEGDDGAGVVALDDVSVRIGLGEFVCITGASGSGKSTLLNILGCLDRPTAGEYRIANRDVGTLSVDGLARLRREMFGFLFQAPNLLDCETIEGNVALPASYAGMPRAMRRRRARCLLDQLGIDRRIGNSAKELSGGEQQRVAIARAMINDPPVLLADEPTGALDSAQGSELMAHLQSMAKRGSAVIVASHDPFVAARAGRRIELRDGRVVADSGSGLADQPGPQFRNVAHEVPSSVSSCLTALRSGFVSLTRRTPTRSRSALAILSTALGIWSAITLLSIAQGTFQEYRKSIGSLGADQITVTGLARGGGIDVSPEDARAIKDNVANVRAAVAGLQGRLEIRYGENAAEADITAGGIRAGGLPTFRYMEYSIGQGGFLESRDNEQAAHVVVLSADLCRTLFPLGTSPVGEFVLVDGTPFLVKGVLAPHPIMQLPVYQEASSFRPAPMVDVNAFVPYNTARGLGWPTLGSYLDVFALETDGLDELARNVRDMLYRRHGRAPLNLLVHSDLIGVWEQAERQQSVVLGGVAVIVLLTSGLGVTGSMLASFNMRRREVGIRLANGARPRDILWQCQAESVMVAAAGGVVGTLLPFLSDSAIEAVADVSVAYASWFTPVALGSALLVGLIFGAVPAYRSARLEATLALMAE